MINFKSIVHNIEVLNFQNQIKFIVLKYKWK